MCGHDSNVTAVDTATGSRLGFLDRAARFADVEDATFDVVVVGAGITGAGVAHDAALRGLRVALVEARDVASGTSSRSSKMIHGGLRYLRQGDVRLVREAARERQTLRRIAPHLTRYAEFTVPCSPSALVTMRAGLTAFERLGRVPRGERHRVLGARRLLAHEPALRPATFSGGVVYPEFLTDDARLTLANVRSAVRAGATVLTHAAVHAVTVEHGRATGVECRSTIDGEALGARIRARVVVNAAGPWVDAVRRLEDAAAPRRVTLTKGIHVVVPAERLNLRATVITVGRDKRPVFAVPTGEVTYIGTTDTFHAEAEVWPGIDGSDVDYLLDAMAATFAGPRLGASDVAAMWAGLRPLASQPGRSPSEISRRDEMWVGPQGVVSIAGGKLTAYRTMAARVVDALSGYLGVRLPACRTDVVTLVGGDLDVERTVADLAGPLGPAHARRLVERYGADAPAIAAAGGDLTAEVRHAVTVEGALRLDDVWVRRTGRAWFGRDPVGADLDLAADVMAGLLGWSAGRRTAEVQTCRDIHRAAMRCLGEGRDDADDRRAGIDVSGPAHDPDPWPVRSGEPAT